FYSINDLHGKLADTDSHPGVDELSTYLENAREKNPYSIFVSPGDIWQGSYESNLTDGLMATDWMNQLGFSAMALGNHEYDWGEEPIYKNAELAEFPLLAINIYDTQTNKQVEYCDSSVIVDLGAVQVGIIGAIGDCYSSIAPEKVENVYFKTGSELTTLVKNESAKLREQGADCIIYLLHDGYGSSKSQEGASISSSQMKGFYDVSLSNGYVDLVFEGHTHQAYCLVDQYGVYHIQHGGDNQNGVSHAALAVDLATGKVSTQIAELVEHNEYTHLEDSPVVAQLMEKYKDLIAKGTEVLGSNRANRGSDAVLQLVADLYYQKGVELWGDDYDIVLGGGYLSLRSPYYLEKGDVTYAMLYSILPFDNELVLCSIKGSDLKKRFFETSNDSYYIGYGAYGESVRNNINSNATYYIIVDSYSASYAPNKLTEIARLNEKVYARDLLAEYIKAGGLQ
ncbi:MAG: 5'-nucleotidase C-terminal domain-containing protein, partial [Oscillospiraceae bacterium]|nr:5'-nucleotidase C-terminal domain-containing protein [Oscillospiraceae bacterium]